MSLTKKARARTAAQPAAAGANGDAKDRVEGDGTDRQRIVDEIAAQLDRTHPGEGVDRVLTRPLDAFRLGVAVALAMGRITQAAADRATRDLSKVYDRGGTDTIAAVDDVCRAAMCARKRGDLKTVRGKR